VSTARLYCGGPCAPRAELGRLLARGKAAIEVRDATLDRFAYEAVLALGYRSLLVLVGSEGRAGTGTDATDLAPRLPAGPAPDMPGRNHDLADAAAAGHAGAPK
jgi:hypothetical protein